MQKVKRFLLVGGALGLCAAAAVWCSGCGKGSGGSKAIKAGAATPIGTPKPGFEGEAPKGALTVTGMDPGKYGGRLVLALPGNPKTFNPLMANDVASMNISHLMFKTCYDFHRLKQEDIAELCESYERSADGLTYTFKLREGLRWSDGKPITTDDFEFSYSMLIDPKIPNSTKDLFKQGTTPEGAPIFPAFEKVDALTFRFTLVRKDVLFHVNVGSIYAVPKHKWLKAYEAGTYSKQMTIQVKPDDLVTSGPFRLRSFKDAESVILERNPNFYKKDVAGYRLPYLDTLMFLIVPDFNSSLLRFREGKTDMLVVRPEDYESLKRDAGTSDYTLVDAGPSFNTNYFLFNLDTRNTKEGAPRVPLKKQRWFQNKNFRKAVSHAIDREGMVRTVLNGRGQPLWSFYSPANKKWSAADKVMKYPYSLDKAREYLTAEGFVTTDGKLHDAQGNHVEFTMVTNSENSTRIAMLNVIQADLKKLGMTAHIRPVPFNDVLDSMRKTHQFDAILLGWGTAIPPDPAQSKNVMLSSGRGHNWMPEQVKPATPWEAKIDDLLMKSTGAYDYETRRRFSDELLVTFSDFQPQIQLVVATDAFAGRRNVGNFKPSSLRPELYWNAESLFLKEPKTRR
jgi:peptide/nickel transport system substrate-binding protein